MKIFVKGNNDIIKFILIIILHVDIPGPVPSSSFSHPFPPLVSFVPLGNLISTFIYYILI